MARPKNDGKGRIGGRQPGTPNKTNAAVKEAVAKVVEDYLDPTPTKGRPPKDRFTLAQDLAQMLPEQRARLIANLAGFVIPKQQALSVEDQTRIEADALTQWLETAPEEAIDAIAAKVLELQAKAKERNHLNS